VSDFKFESREMKETRQESQISASSNIEEAMSKRILLADDSKAIRDLVSGFLEFIGYEVALAIDGIEALAVFLESAFDLVLTDLEMPAMDGLCLAGRIKERSPDTPVILLSGADRETVLKKMEKGQVDFVIFKPFMLEDLQDTIQVALAPREPEHGSVGGEATSFADSPSQRNPFHPGH
jgi:CheY-like chemotaxis protein